MESDEEKRRKKLKRDIKDKVEHEDEYDDKPPRGRRTELDKENDDS